MIRRLSMLCFLIALVVGPSTSVLAAEGSADARWLTTEDDRPQPSTVDDDEYELLASAVASQLQQDARTQTVAGCRYCGLDWNTTTSDYGQGTNCLQARRNLIDVLRQQTACAYGICSEELVIEVPCSEEQPGAYVVSGYLKYKCWIEF